MFNNVTYKKKPFLLKNTYLKSVKLVILYFVECGFYCYAVVVVACAK
jgi:hypothetical protein